MKWFLTFHLGGDVDNMLFHTLDEVFEELSSFFKLPQPKSSCFWGELEKALPNDECVTLEAHLPGHHKVKLDLHKAWGATLSAHNRMPFEAHIHSQMKRIKYLV